MGNPGRIILSLGSRGLLKWVPDKMYLQMLVKSQLGYKVDFEAPKTYNEKLQWLKLYDRKPEYSRMVDKYAVREYIAEKIGEQYLIPLVGGPWERVEDIDFDALPEQFVLKTTHDSGGVVICYNKDNFDKDSALAKLRKHMKREYFWGKREWPYKDVPHRIIAEKYMEDSRDSELRDYKLFAFNGRVRAMFIASERFSKNSETKFDFFDENFIHLDIRNGYPNAKEIPHRPSNFEEMKSLASKLSKGIPQLRVDFYEVNGKIYFGELTFTHWGGIVPFEPKKWDNIFGDWIELPEKTV